MLARLCGFLLELRLHFENDVILIQLREHGGDLALAKSVVQRVVDHLRRDSESRRGVAIDHQPGLQPAILLIAGDIAQFRQRFEASPRICGAQRVKFVGVRIFQAVLILRPAHTVFDSEILHRLHEQRDAFDLRQLRLQAADDVAGADVLSLVQRFQIDLNAAAVERRVRAVDADERRETFHRRIFQDHTRPAPAAARPSRGNEMVCGASEIQGSRRYPERERILSERRCKAAPSATSVADRDQQRQRSDDPAPSEASSHRTR